MGKQVVIDGEVSATPGTTPLKPADKGLWSAGPVTTTPYQKLLAGGRGKNTISQAKCTFTFAGTDSKSNNAPVSGTEVVTLVAKQTKLTSGGSVLVSGDEEQGQHGNKLHAKASERQKLATA